MPPVKQLVALRRKAGPTKEEYRDYHYQKHGAISTGPTPAETPSDGVTELYFDSPEHLKHVFQSEWVAQKVGPDGANFSDVSAVLPMFMREDTVPLTITGASASQTHQLDGNAFVAMYFVALRNQQTPSGTIISELVSCIDCYASQEVLAMVVNTPDDTDFNLGAYFGGEPPVRFQFVFTITLRGKESMGAIRKAQIDFKEKIESLDLPATWIGFGERAVVLDRIENVKFDARRQPFKRST
ncbi:hypothetical protein COH20_011362 [Aspergillus flavus]|nr:hypothetical protein COH20_011362 [Aspergillus flavus]RAQ79217.1 hypothetical protein COH21_012680 [Aspergillus flavus]